jgi:hypothetical protein
VPFEAEVIARILTQRHSQSPADRGLSRARKKLSRKMIPLSRICCFAFMHKNSTCQRASKPAATIAPSRWAAYATAGAATAISCTSVANADIHYLSVNEHLDGAGHPMNAELRQFDLVPGAYLTFLQVHNTAANRGLAGFYFGTLGAVSAQFIGVVGTFNGNEYHYVGKLDLGDSIVGGKFLPNAGRGAFGASNPLASGPGYPNSQWASITTGFMGFKFNIGNGVQYGWARISMDGPNVNTFTLIDYAYADPGETLVAGQVPEPGSLGLLALGAAGLLAWRKQRGSSATAN